RGTSSQPNPRPSLSHRPPARCSSVEEAIRRTPYRTRPAVEHVRVDHRGADITVAEQLLHRANVVPVLQQVGSEAVAEGVAGRRLTDPRAQNGRPDHPLNRGLMEMVPPAMARLPVDVRSGRGK